MPHPLTCYFNFLGKTLLILRIYFAVDGMPIEMYGESWIAGLLTSDDVMLHMAGFGTMRGI